MIHIYWQDQAEYYYICSACYDRHGDTQWSGSTYVHDWPATRVAVQREAQRLNTLQTTCEWCRTVVDPQREAVVS